MGGSHATLSPQYLLPWPQLTDTNAWTIGVDAKLRHFTGSLTNFTLLSYMAWVLILQMTFTANRTDLFLSLLPSFHSGLINKETGVHWWPGLSALSNLAKDEMDNVVNPISSVLADDLNGNRRYSPGQWVVLCSVRGTFVLALRKINMTLLSPLVGILFTQKNWGIYLDLAGKNLNDRWVICISNWPKRWTLTASSIASVFCRI